MVMGNTRGLFDWIVQRTTALLIGAYTVFLVIFFLIHQPLHYRVWHSLFLNPFMRIATLLVILSILWHAWIGMWTVLTDYVKCGVGRLFLEVLIIIALASYLMWCLTAILQ